MLATHTGMNPTTDYTAAPACTLLATSCACCGRALLDAASALPSEYPGWMVDRQNHESRTANRS